MTQAQLAGTKVAARTISRIERGHVRPSRRVLTHIAERVGRPLQYFVGGAAPQGLDVDYLLARAQLRELAGDRAGAERLAARAVELASAAGDPARLALARLERLTLAVGRLFTPQTEAELVLAQGEAARFGHSEAVARSHYALAAALENGGHADCARAALRAGWKALDGRWPEVAMRFAAALARLAASGGGDAEGLSRLIHGLGRACAPRGVARAYETKAGRAYAAGEAGAALDAARHALAFRRFAAGQVCEAQAHYQLGQLARRRGSDGDAVAEFTRACALARAAGDTLTEVHSLVSLGALHSRAGRAGEAARALADARTVFLRVTEPRTRRAGSAARAASGLDAVPSTHRGPADPRPPRAQDAGRRPDHPRD